MKRNKAQRNVTTASDGKSRYAVKIQRKRMMYGPGCCGHKHVQSILTRKEV